MNNILNYTGQLRLYSLLDLALLLYVAGARGSIFVGGLFLWIAFLVYLETRHAHEYRASLPSWLWLALGVFGLVLYGRPEGLLFVLAGYFYAKKNQRHFALVSPLFRGLQNFFLVAGLVGYQNPLVWIVLVLIIIRNVIGDFRDIEKDSREGMRTWPMLIHWHTNLPYAHLIFMLLTTFVWWSYSSLNFYWLISIWVVQLATYNLTPR